ncbi:MAG: hypothetical protein ACTHQ3_09455 [Motilibacteraceae bacterium]
MNSDLATAVVWPSNTAAPPPGWTRLTDSDGAQPSGWFTQAAGPYRTVVKGYPTWAEVPWPIPAEACIHDEEDDEDWQGPFDLTYTTYTFPNLATAAGPATHSFGNLDFCGGWIHELAMTPGGMRQNEALLARVLSGAKPTGLLVGAEADAYRWAEAARSTGLTALVSRDWNTKVWITPRRLGDRVNQRSLRATWHAIASGAPDRARAASLLDTVDRGLDLAFDLDLTQPLVQRGAVMLPPWWDEDSDAGWVVLGAVLGYPPSATYSRLTGC